ncbi:MAG TPA: 6,7-dimethyl-8-ribityllumazine synthase [Opitutae bacterium]|nr:6,7-dimethyl-8-ribityllumazine synthase [Opitutaceae bacterium]HCR29518.1 6,7-dimethyl-8-ribityllumazine synthase [Opitutae bacterium]|tara:strand:+ start:756 stop:1226 length:471 start_codon:yes stop_codon:yes gene_type:complete
MSRLSPEPASIDGADFKVAIVAARYNQTYVEGLLEGVLSALSDSGVPDEQVSIERVPGSNELPIAVQMMAGSERYDVIVALGAIIAGGTRHYEMVADGSNMGLQQVALESGIPVVNGVIVGDSEEQVRERCVGSIPKGKEFGECALEMAHLRRRLR